MVDRLAQLVADAEALARDFDASVLDGPDAKYAVCLTVKAQRYFESMKTSATARVGATGAWVTGGDRSPERWLARVSGVSVGEAARQTTTAEALDALPATAQAQREGKLSAPQVQLVAQGATIDPSREMDLLATAKSATLTKLRDEVTRIKMAHIDRDVNARTHATRSHRSWTGKDGAYCYEGRMSPINGAHFERVLEAYRDKVHRDHKRTGEIVARDAEASDALVRMVEAAEGSGAEAERCTLAQLRAILVLDLHAYVRDKLEASERCELVGHGPIDLHTAKRLLGADPIIDLAITDGIDVRTLVHAGRHPTLSQWLALYAAGPMCTSTGCGRRDHLQADHSPEYELTKHTTVEELKLKCPSCHYRKTHLGWRDGPRQPDGTYLLLAPDEAHDEPDPPDTT